MIWLARIRVKGDFRLMEINSALFILVFLPVVLVLCNFVQVHFDNRYRC